MTDPYRFIHRLRVRWGECDMQGIVFNPHYMALIDVALTEYWRDIGLPYPDALAAEGFRANALYPDGRQSTGQAAYHAYAKASFPVFARVGGRQIWLGRFEHMLIGPADERWDAVFIAEYPATAAFVEMLRDPAYREAVKHRQAAVADSRLIRLAPAAAGLVFGQG